MGNYVKTFVISVSLKGYIAMDITSQLLAIFVPDTAMVNSVRLNFINTHDLSIYSRTNALMIVDFVKMFLVQRGRTGQPAVQTADEH